MQHNKKRNTALVYEFLIRYITKCLLENNAQQANAATVLVKRYFASGPLREELNLFETLTKSPKALDTHYAGKLVGAVLTKAKALDWRHLERSKNQLIREINYKLDSNALYKTKVPYYPAYASLQTLIDFSNGKRRQIDDVARVQLEQRVVAFLTQERTLEKAAHEALKLDPQYNNAVYKMVIRKFDEKYKDTLDEAQKKLLTKYAISLMSENKKVFTNALMREINNVNETLATITDKEICADTELAHRIEECRQALKTLDVANMDQQKLVTVLKYMTLAREVA